MKITTFKPMIVTKDAESVISLFEALGFEKRHAPTVDIGTAMVTSTRMKNADGFSIDIADVKTVPQDIAMIRMNVDNFEEAYDLLISHGFKNTRGETIDTKSNKSAGLVSPTGFRFDLCQHIKDHD